MTKVSFDSDSLGFPASDGHCADVRGPSAGYVIPLMMGKKFIGETAKKIVRLSDIYRIPKCRPLQAKDVDAGDRVEFHSAEGKVLEFVPRAALADPD
jgi:hypothetical protein